MRRNRLLSWSFRRAEPQSEPIPPCCRHHSSSSHTESHLEDLSFSLLGNRMGEIVAWLIQSLDEEEASRLRPNTRQTLQGPLAAALLPTWKCVRTLGPDLWIGIAQYHHLCPFQPSFHSSHNRIHNNRSLHLSIHQSKKERKIRINRVHNGEFRKLGKGGQREGHS